MENTEQARQAESPGEDEEKRVYSPYSQYFQYLNNNWRTERRTRRPRGLKNPAIRYHNSWSSGSVMRSDRFLGLAPFPNFQRTIENDLFKVPEVPTPRRKKQNEKTSIIMNPHIPRTTIEDKGIYILKPITVPCVKGNSGGLVHFSNSSIPITVVADSQYNNASLMQKRSETLALKPKNSVGLTDVRFVNVSMIIPVREGDVGWMKQRVMEIGTPVKIDKEEDISTLAGLNSYMEDRDGFMMMNHISVSERSQLSVNKSKDKFVFSDMCTSDVGVAGVLMDMVYRRQCNAEPVIPPDAKEVDWKKVRDSYTALKNLEICSKIMPFINTFDNENPTSKIDRKTVAEILGRALCKPITIMKDDSYVNDKIEKYIFFTADTGTSEKEMVFSGFFQK